MVNSNNKVARIVDSKVYRGNDFKKMIMLQLTPLHWKEEISQIPQHNPWRKNILSM